MKKFVCLSATLLVGLITGTSAWSQSVDMAAAEQAKSESRAGPRIPPVMSLIGNSSGTNVGGPDWVRPFADGTCCSGLGPVKYHVEPFFVSASEACDVSSVQTGGWDGYVFIYQTAFDPLNQTVNFVAGDDDGVGGIGTSNIDNVNLAAGTTYYFVTTGFENGEVGEFTSAVDCPTASVTFGAGGITLASPASNEPIVIADELTFDDPRLFANPSGAFNISTEIDYSFSPGEVRYARLECPGVEFTTATISYSTVDASNNFGAINRVGSGDAIYFSITAGATPVVADDTFTIDGTRTVTTRNNVSCTYGLYDFPSQAQVGGSTGRVVTTSGAYISFAPSYSLVVNSQGATVANVESEDPAFSTFVAAAPTGSNQLAQIGGFSYGTVADVNGDTQPITLDGEAIELSDLMDSDTALVFGGDFSAAGDVFLDDDADCSSALVSADEFDESEARFFIGSDSYLDTFLCFEVGGEPIAAGSYTVSLDAVSADDDTYAVTDLGAYALGEITRNGAELQAPLAQVPSGFISRMVLTNTGNTPRAYEIEVLGEDGNVITTDNLQGMVPANGTLVVDLSTVLTAFTAAPRATLNVTVAGPNAQIQGLYQIVNTDTGAISNHVMVRPGKN